MVLRCSRGKKRIKNGLKLNKKITKTVIWSFSDTFLTYFWLILLRNNTSFHLRLITLICDHFDEFYKQKTDQKRAEKSSKTVKNHPKSVISSHIHTRYGHNMASYGLFTWKPSIHSYLTAIWAHMRWDMTSIGTCDRKIGKPAIWGHIMTISGVYVARNVQFWVILTTSRSFFDLFFACKTHQNDHRSM